MPRAAMEPISGVLCSGVWVRSTWLAAHHERCPAPAAAVHGRARRAPAQHGRAHVQRARVALRSQDVALVCVRHAYQRQRLQRGPVTATRRGGFTKVRRNMVHLYDASYPEHLSPHLTSRRQPWPNPHGNTAESVFQNTIFRNRSHCGSHCASMDVFLGCPSMDVFFITASCSGSTGARTRHSCQWSSPALSSRPACSAHTVAAQRD